MPVRWYLCPYDTTPGPGGNVARRCAMRRHIPRMPNAAGAVWEEVEVLGNRTLVRVRAPLAALALIDADLDFTEIPSALPTVPLARRPAVRSALNNAGYGDPEITATGWDLQQLLALVAGVRGQVRLRADRTGFEVDAGVRLPPLRLLRELVERVADDGT